MNTEKKAMLAAAAAYFIFGLSYLFSKMALNITDPAILLWARFTVTFAVLNLLVLTRAARVSYKGKHVLYAVLLGVLQPVLYFVFENYGVRYTNASFAGLLASISPILSALLGAVFLKERPNRKQWLCIVISIAGVMLVSVRGGGGQNTAAGVVCLVLAYSLGGIYALVVRTISKEFTAFEMTYMMFAVGFVFFTAWAFVSHGADTVSLLCGALAEPSFTVSVLYLGIAASICAYFLSNYSLAHLPVARSTIFSNFATVVSVLAGVIIMKDPFGWVQAVAFVLILSGVIGVNLFRNKNEA